MPRLYQDQSLDVALRFMKDRPMLPVVHRGNLDLLIGVVSVEDILRAYRKAGWPSRRRRKFPNEKPGRRTPEREKASNRTRVAQSDSGECDVLKWKRCGAHTSWTG